MKRRPLRSFIYNFLFLSEIGTGRGINIHRTARQSAENISKQNWNESTEFIIFSCYKATTEGVHVNCKTSLMLLKHSLSHICSLLRMRSSIPIKYFTNKRSVSQKYMTNLPKHWKIHEHLAYIDQLKTGHQWKHPPQLYHQAFVKPLS